MEKTFRALRVNETADGKFTRGIVTRSLRDLPPGEVLVRVHYSSLNYKDALSASGNKGVTRNYPHTPGIDAAGVVEESASPEFAPGDEVLISSAQFGVSVDGGFSEYARVPAGWVLRRPAGLSLRECMAYGVPGFTAALCVLRLQEAGVRPGQGEVVVTGATGGVGSLAVALLALCGYAVVAATGKLEQADFLRDLGAQAVILREEIDDTSGKGLLKSRWAGGVDTVGGNYLSTVLKGTRYGGAVACCGNAASGELATSVYPFILRGVSLLGVDTANVATPVRQQVWERLAGDWKLPQLGQITHACSLEELSFQIERILHGEQVGRVVVELLG